MGENEAGLDRAGCNYTTLGLAIALLFAKFPNSNASTETSQRLSGSGSTVYSNSNVEDHKRHIGGDMGRGAGNAMYMPQGAMTKLLEVVKLP
ncbi:hypothetical protein ACO22_04971 [Paracoccidioides brasiliensis]|uniref:Uncharacterized protein n=1 Tax=Paracoccidioides brasiliensis TaxID=121759 RepID=A0A1D2JBL9_PARBR|nr:hypothetical protein ACO22_04971 [Paracoccidioides brasiliensis]ODH48928.1 hypothetical protein GX48_04977 [Paracoccidioides brasiliensis]